jgi:ABC-type transporter Mla maintaining outer membrane lipid asymmetry ATPase subunit MlaF
MKEEKGEPTGGLCIKASRVDSFTERNSAFLASRLDIPNARDTGVMGSRASGKTTLVEADRGD